MKSFFRFKVGFDMQMHIWVGRTSFKIFRCQGSHSTTLSSQGRLRLHRPDLWDYTGYIVVGISSHNKTLYPAVQEFIHC